MSGHRLTRFLGALIILTAIFFFAVSIGAVVLMSNGALADTFGAGWTGWLFLPVIAGALMSGVVLLVFGSVLLFLTRIDDNLRAAVIRRTGHPVENIAPVTEPAAVAPVAEYAVRRPSVPIAPEEPDAVAEPLLPDLQSTRANIYDYRPSPVSAPAAKSAPETRAASAAAATTVVIPADQLRREETQAEWARTAETEVDAAATASGQTQSPASGEVSAPSAPFAPSVSYGAAAGPGEGAPTPGFYADPAPDPDAGMPLPAPAAPHSDVGIYDLPEPPDEEPFHLYATRTYEAPAPVEPEPPAAEPFGQVEPPAPASETPLTPATPVGDEPPPADQLPDPGADPLPGPRLPGVDEAARVAAEMAALKKPRKRRVVISDDEE